MEFCDAQLRQGFEQKRPVPGIAGLHLLQFLTRIEGRLGSDLAQVGHADRQVLLQLLDRPDQDFRQDQPADTPPGHAVVFRERVHDYRIGREGERGLGRLLVGQPVVDLIRDEGDAQLITGCADSGQILAAHHRARGIGRAHQQDAVERRSRMGRHDHLSCDDIAAGLAGLDTDGLDTQRMEDVEIGGVTGSRNSHPRTGIEQGQEGQQEAPGRAGRHDDAVRRHINAIGFAVMPGNASPQARTTERFGIADPPASKRRGGSVPDHARRWAAWLADFKVDDVMSASLDLAGG